MSDYPAHIRCEKDGMECVQTVEEHCRSTAEYARQMLAARGLSVSAYLAGLIHDAGKFTVRFREYITRAAHGEEARRGSVNHTFAGVRFLMERYHTDALEFADIAAELLALAVGSHHGWFDCVDEKRQNGFEHRKNKTDIGYEEAIGNFLRSCADENELSALFNESVKELEPVLERIFEMSEHIADGRRLEETLFYTGLLARLLLSVVIEGDRRDTASFMSDVHFPTEANDDERRQLWDDCLHRVEGKLSEFSQDTDIQKARRDISDQCRAFAEKESGIYRLNVPTGGGKTLSSLRYALAHAAKWKKRRLFFISPLLSILEQNAKVIRDFVQNDDIILEHHSNLVRTENSKDELDVNELLTETYDAPVIITTLVQLLNTLFSGKAASIRRFHTLCDSVIVIDEVQTVPNKMLSLFSLAVNFLVKICGATVVLCSATQPCVEKIDHPLHEPIDEIVPFDPVIWNPFKRTDIRDCGALSLEEIVSFALDILSEADSLLIVCNKKNEASELFHRLKDFGGDCYHLSASMCTQHRRDVLDRIKESLKRQDGTKTLCVSTQVIEAGVDISFGQVIRFAAGMDSVVQAAGRCNRNGEAGEGVTAPVCLVQCRNENLNRLPDIQRGKDATTALLCDFSRNPAQFSGSLSSDEAIEYYYRALYQDMPCGYQDYPVKGKPSLLSLLTLNERYADAESPHCGEYLFHQAFRLAGSLFEVFDQDTTDVLVPYGEGEKIITNLSSERAKYDLHYVKEQVELAKPYTVSLYRYQVDALQRERALCERNGGVLTLIGHYDSDTGFSDKETELNFLEV